jgi:alpha-galactosidase
MKKLCIILMALVIVSCQRTINEIVIPLNSDWKFIQGDNLDYAASSFDDSGWKNIKVDKIWEEQGYDPYDGFAWFRFRVVIPSDLHKQSYLQDSLRLFLGKINNFDQTFLNGKIIGINGKNMAENTVIDTAFLKAPMQLWDYERRYVLSVDDSRILWDKENVIAVRVFDQGGQGGLYTGNQKLSMVNIKEYLSFDNRSNPFLFSESKISKAFQVKNTSKALTLKGILSIRANNKMTGDEVYNMNQEVILEPQSSKQFKVEFPQIDQSALIVYNYSFKGTNETYEYREETPYILTPSAPLNPRINGAMVIGARPGRPFLFTIPASGERPMIFKADPLPAGLMLDSNTGIITGSVKQKGEYKVNLTASSAKGETSRELRIIIGDQIALTPPMGWNSWNCWGLSVDEQKVLSSAKVYIDKGLVNHGWAYINIDDGWEIPKDKEPKRYENGDIITNEKFPDMKRLGDGLHAMGLKFGIYSSPGPLTCGLYTASYQYELNDAKSYAKWGVDYLKYDWCSYNGIAKDTSLAERKKPYFVMRDALNKVNRDIVYSLCQYGMSNVWQWGAEVGGNLWRTTGDITDTWESMSGIGFNQINMAQYAKPGNWNDPDMLVVGWVGWGPNLHPSKLSPDEQYTHISLWCLLSSPLLIGCDLERLDDFTLNLLTNDEVLAINQDPLGKQATPIVKEGDIQVWMKMLEDGSDAFGIFNLGDSTIQYNLDLSRMGFIGDVKLRDLWRQVDLGTFTGTFQTGIPSHGVVLVKTLK